MTGADLRAVLAALARTAPSAPPPDPVDPAVGRAEAQRRLAAGEITLTAFNREWRRLERPGAATVAAPPDELRLRRARSLLERFGDLWADPAVSGDLRTEAAHELFARIDIDGPTVVALHPQPNENAWLLGYAALRDGSLTTQRQMGMVGATGFEPPVPIGLIVVAPWMLEALRGAA